MPTNKYNQCQHVIKSIQSTFKERINCASIMEAVFFFTINCCLLSFVVFLLLSTKFAQVKMSTEQCQCSKALDPHSIRNNMRASCRECHAPNSAYFTTQYFLFMILNKKVVFSQDSHNPHLVLCIESLRPIILLKHFNEYSKHRCVVL